MIYSLFIDESGDHGLSNIDPSFPVFVLCGVLFASDAKVEMEERVDELKKEFWGDKKVILHSRDIRKCEKEFQILFNMEIKNRFYSLLNSTITGSNYKVFAAAIDKNAHVIEFGRLANDVYEIALSFIIEQCVLCLNEIAKVKSQLNIIIEKRGRKEDAQLAAHIQRIQTRGTGLVTADALAAYEPDVKFCSKGDDVAGLQLADLVAYPIARYIMDEARANPAFDLVKAKIYSRENEMIGLKRFP